MMPLITACLGYLLFRERPAKQALVGLIIGFAGIELLLRPGAKPDMFGVMLVVAAQISWALGAVLAPRLRLPEDPHLAAGLELLGGSGILLVASAIWGEFHRLRLEAVSSSSWLGLGWLVVRMLVATAVVVTGVCLIVSSSGSEPERRRHHPMTSGHGQASQPYLSEGGQMGRSAHAHLSTKIQ